MGKKPDVEGSKAVAIPEGAAGLPAVAEGLDEMESFAGLGMEKVTAKDVLVPRLGLLQALSDQLKRSKSAYIEGAEIGDICDLGTNELMPKPMHVVPVVYDKVWIEWAPRSSGKGIVNIYPDESIMARTRLGGKNGKTPMLGENLIAETAQFYLLNLSAGRRPSFLPFTSTQLQKARRWITLAQGERLTNSAGREYVPPLFYRTYYLSSAMESNNEGEWAGWTIQRGPALPEIENWRNIMADATKFAKSVAEGLMKGDLRETPEEGVIDGQASRVPDDEVPF